MIRICKYLYINILTVIFFCTCYAFGKESFFLVSYFSMFLHELGHLTAALLIGLKPSRISLHPFGVNLRLKSTFVYSLADEIILYISGPLVNIILALIFNTVFHNTYAFSVNIALFITNILPIIPLDGGNILKKVISFKAGETIASYIIRISSFLIGTIIFLTGVYSVYITGYNYSVIFMSILIFANIFTEKEKYTEDTLKGIICSTDSEIPQHGTKVRIFAAEENTSPRRIIKNLRPGKYTLIAVIDKNGQLKKFVTQKELLYLLKNHIDF